MPGRAGKMAAHDLAASAFATGKLGLEFATKIDERAIEKALHRRPHLTRSSRAGTLAGDDLYFYELNKWFKSIDTEFGDQVRIAYSEAKSDMFFNLPNIFFKNEGRYGIRRNRGMPCLFEEYDDTRPTLVELWQDVDLVKEEIIETDGGGNNELSGGAYGIDASANYRVTSTLKKFLIGFLCCLRGIVDTSVLAARCSRIILSILMAGTAVT